MQPRAWQSLSVDVKPPRRNGTLPCRRTTGPQCNVGRRSRANNPQTARSAYRAPPERQPGSQAILGGGLVRARTARRGLTGGSQTGEVSSQRGCRVKAGLLLCPSFGHISGGLTVCAGITSIIRGSSGLPCCGWRASQSEQNDVPAWQPVKIVSGTRLGAYLRYGTDIRGHCR